MNNTCSLSGNFVSIKKIINSKVKTKAGSHRLSAFFLWSYLPKFSFFFGNAPANKKLGKKKPDPTETIDYEIHQMVGINILEILQSYLWENKTVKGGLPMELPLSVYSDLKINLTYTH